MNCLEARRLLLTEPERRDPALSEHLASCASCAAQAARSAHLERLMKDAVNIPVPEGLASRILLRHEFSDAPRSRWGWPAGLAATLAILAIGALLTFGVQPRHGGPLGSELVALIGAAPYALQASGPVRRDEVAAALEPVGLALHDEIGQVTFASRCLVRGKLAGHLVLKGETAPITVFLIPHTLVEERADVASATLAGVLLPDRAGTIAIVGAPGERLGALESRVRAAVRWPA